MVPAYFIKSMKNAQTYMMSSIILERPKIQRDALYLFEEGLRRLVHASEEECLSCETKGFSDVLIAVNVFIQTERDNSRFKALRDYVIKMRNELEEHRIDQEINKAANASLPRAEDGTVLLN